MTFANSFSFRFLLPSILIHGFCFALLFFFNANQLIKAPFGAEDISVEMFLPIDVPVKISKQVNPVADHQDSTASFKNEKLIDLAEVQKNKYSENTAQVGTASGDKNASETARYLYGLRKLIESRKIYPTQARRNGETGLVVVGLLVHRDGGIENFKIKQSSSSARLDQAALETVSSVKRYVPFPDEISSQSLEIDVPIEFAL